MKTASWVIDNKRNLRPLMETFDPITAHHFERYSTVYQVVPILEWLQHVARLARGEASYI